MLAVDTNVLVYAHRREPSEHDSARSYVNALAEGSDPWAIPWPCVFEFWSVVTSARIWKDAASSPRQANAQLEAWFASPTVRLLAETPDVVTTLATFAERPRIRGPIVHDARIAAICIAHGVTALASRDRDFSLFPELTILDPLRAP